MYRIAIVFVVIILSVFALFGCNKKPEYKVDYHGQKDFFRGSRDSFTAGSSVRLVFDLIATDTDYSFFVTADDYNVNYENGAYVISFIMPEHDVEVYFDSVNTMVNMSNTED